MAKKAVENGDTTAKKVLDDFGIMLGCGLTNLVNIFQPEIICLGGGLANAGNLLLDPVQRILDAEDYLRLGKMRSRLCKAELGNDAGLIGAAMIGRYRVD